MPAKMTDYGNNIAGLRRALRSLPKEAKVRLKEASYKSAQVVAEDATGTARSLAASPKGGGWKHLGPTIKPYRGDIPEVKIGGQRRIPGHSGQVGQLLWGLEFGGGARPTTQQFMPHLGRTGYALWPAVHEHSAETFRFYSEALADALDAI